MKIFLYSFAETSYNLIKDYFAVDWLMARAWVTLSSLNQLPICLQYYPEVSPYTCSLVVVRPCNQELNSSDVSIAFYMPFKFNK